MYQIIFIDLDGALVGKEDIISPRTMAAQRSALDRGVTIVVCTARNPYTADHITDRIGCSGFGIYSNGAAIRRPRGGGFRNRLACGRRRRTGH
jgi:hydroxymethylpyrimidine pyrophosphatase-like HAD family hydrolase